MFKFQARASDRTRFLLHKRPHILHHKARLPQLGFFSGRARHFSQTGSNRPLFTQAENGDRREVSAPLRGTGWEPRRVVHGNLYSQGCQRLFCRSDGCAQRQGAEGTLLRDAGGRPPLPTHALPTLRGPRAPFSRCDRIFFARTECVGTVLPSRWCAAAWNVNFSNLGKLLVAEAAGVQRRQRHGNTMIVCAVWRLWVPRMSVC